jgi:hypothetical protein
MSKNLVRSKRQKVVVGHKEHLKFNKEEIRRVPDVAGIYVIFDSRKVPLYVGRSGGGHGRASIQRRLKRHLTSKSPSQKKLQSMAMTFSYYALEPNLVGDVETLIIRSFSHILLSNRTPRQKFTYEFKKRR